MDNDSLDLVKMMAEELDDELKPYVTDGPVGKCLKHPLVFDPIAIVPGLANRRLYQKKQQLEKAVRKGDYRQALWLYERPYRMPMVLEWQDEVDNDLLRELLVSAWMDTEFPFQYDQEELLAIFRRLRPVSDVSGVDDKYLEHLKGATVYRGVGSPKYMLGFSWTKSAERAEWFAKRFRTNGAVYVVQIKSIDNILGIFEGRGESEVLLDPTTLKGIKVAEGG